MQPQITFNGRLPGAANNALRTLRGCSDEETRSGTKIEPREPRLLAASIAPVLHYFTALFFPLLNSRTPELFYSLHVLS